MNVNTVVCCDWRDLMASLADDSADLILTDMPYGTTACSWDTVIDLDAWWVEANRVAKPRAAIVCTGSQPFTSRLVMSNVKRFRYEWVWDKALPNGVLNSKIMPLKQHENILVFSSEGVPSYFPIMISRDLIRVNAGNNKAIGGDGNSPYGARRGVSGIYTHRFPTTIVAFSNANQADKQHPTQKPVALFEYLIRTYTQPGDLVVDPFVGSGTTALAARNTGRRFICGDFTQEYVDIANARLVEPYTPDMFDTLLPPDDDPGPVQQALDFG